MAYTGPHIKIEGLRELQVALKVANGRLPKSIGEAHKEVGRFVISKIPPGDPNAVGAGAGTKIRPSATKREVLLRVGYSGRRSKLEQWGKRPVQPFARMSRPHIIKAVEDNQDEIEAKFLDEIFKAVGPAFFSTRKL